MARFKLRIGKKRKKQTGELSTFQLLWRTTNGKIGISLLIILAILGIYATAYYTPQGMRDYEKSQLWSYLYPERAPPCWARDKAPYLAVTLEDLQQQLGVVTSSRDVSEDLVRALGGAQGFNASIAFFKNLGYTVVYKNYTYTFHYEAENKAKPNDASLAIAFNVSSNVYFNTKNSTFVVLNAYLERPDGNTIYFYKAKKWAVRPGKTNILAGNVLKNVTFLNKFYRKFIAPTSLNGIDVLSTAGHTGFQADFAESVREIAIAISGLPVNETAISNLPKPAEDLIKTTGAGKLIFLEKAPDGGLQVVPGDYKIVIEVLYVVPSQYVLQNGQYNEDYAKANNASLYLSDFKFIIKSNCFGFFGTDDKGRPVGLGLLFGIPYAFVLGFLVTFSSTFIGAFYGSAAGYWKDIRGEALMRVVDVVNSLPFLPILIAISVAMGGSLSLWWLAALMIVLFWAGPVIVVRSMALQISEQIYVEAAKAVGASTWRILFKHIFPQIFPYTVAIAVLSMPGVIIAEASLSVLGLGDPTAPTWGKMLNGAYEANAVITGMWWYYIFPGLALVVFSATFLLIGRALEPLVAPKLIK